MNYVLVLIDYLPDNLNVIINSILSVDKDSKIYICSDKNHNIDKYFIFQILFSQDYFYIFNNNFSKYIKFI